MNDLQLSMRAEWMRCVGDLDQKIFKLAEIDETFSDVNDKPPDKDRQHKAPLLLPAFPLHGGSILVVSLILSCVNHNLSEK